MNGKRVASWCLIDKGIHHRAMFVIHYTKEHKRNSQRNAPSKENAHAKEFITWFVRGPTRPSSRFEWKRMIFSPVRIIFNRE